MRLIYREIYNKPDFNEYPWITAIFVHFRSIGFTTVTIGSVLALGILAAKFHSFAAFVVSYVIFAVMFLLCIIAVLASLLPYPWWCGSTGN